MINADGTGRRCVGVSSATDSTPAWSSDGQWIAFQSNRMDSANTNDFEIWITRADGSGIARRLTTDPSQDFGPMFAYGPSNRIVWHNAEVGGGANSFELLAGRVNFSTGELVPGSVTVIVSRPGVPDANGSFSPDSDQDVVFGSCPDGEDGQSDIFILINGNLRNLTNHLAEDTNPSW